MCRFVSQVDRTGKKFSIQPVKVPKDYSWKNDIMEMIDYCCEEGVVMDITLPTKEKPMRHQWPASKVRLGNRSIAGQKLSKTVVASLIAEHWLHSNGQTTVFKFSC